MKLKFLGTGTSQGVPVIGCSCKVCVSEDPKDARLRASVLITTDLGKKILIDCGPDFRQQMIRSHETDVAVTLLTHEHNDHVIGLDDMRPLIFKTGKNMPLYCSRNVGEEVKKRFAYAFADERYPGAPAFDLHIIKNEKFSAAGCEILPVEVSHFKTMVFGYKFKNTTYITDASAIADEEKTKLKNLDILVLNCIRKTDPHPAHFILEDIIALQKELRPKKILLTHISHHFGLHAEENQQLPADIALAYDGMEIEF